MDELVLKGLLGRADSVNETRSNTLSTLSPRGQNSTHWVPSGSASCVHQIELKDPTKRQEVKGVGGGGVCGHWSVTHEDRRWVGEVTGTGR